MENTLSCRRGDSPNIRRQQYSLSKLATAVRLSIPFDVPKLSGMPKLSGLPKLSCTGILKLSGIGRSQDPAGKLASSPLRGRLYTWWADTPEPRRNVKKQMSEHTSPPAGRVSLTRLPLASLLRATEGGNVGNTLMKGNTSTGFHRGQFPSSTLGSLNNRKREGTRLV